MGWWQRGSSVAAARQGAAYLLAVALPLALSATQVRAEMVHAPLFLFFFAVVLVTLCGGLGPGILCVAASALLGNFFFLGRPGEASLSGSAARDTALFAGASLLVSLLQTRLQQAGQSLRRALRSRDEFLAVAGHELANPLSALEIQMQGRRRRLQRAGPPGPATAETIGALDQQLATVARLRGLVRELLDVSRIRQGRLILRPEPVELTALVQRVAAGFEEVAFEAGCTLSVRTGDAVVGHWDPLRIEQVVANLLGNALKYGAGAPVAVALQADAHWAELSIADGGPGIAPEHQARVFGRFERVTTTADRAGLGLGLWIVQQIAEASGGRVEVSSELGHGARFCVRLPRGGPAADATAAGARL